MSRPRKPVEAKIIAGTFRADRDGRGDEPMPKRGRPAMPRFLGKVGRRVWRELVPELDRLGLLTVVDRTALAGFCVACEELEAACEIIAREGRTCLGGSGGIKVHPAVMMQRSALKAVKDFAALFGLDPASRGRIHAPAAEAQDSGLERLFDGSALG